MIPTPHPEPLSRGASPEVEAELRALCASPAPGPMTWRAVRSQIICLLDQIAADREMREEAATLRRLWARKCGGGVEFHHDGAVSVCFRFPSREESEEFTNSLASLFLAKLRTAVPVDGGHGG